MGGNGAAHTSQVGITLASPIHLHDPSSFNILGVAGWNFRLYKHFKDNINMHKPMETL
jgi:hypothetical protein